MTKKTGSKEAINKIEIGNTVINDPAVIAQKFNDFFVNVGSDLVKKIPTGSHTPADFLTGNYCNSMFFSPTTTEEVRDIINNLKNSNSTIGPRAFAISAPSAWNRLPADLRDPSHSLLTFRKKLKTFLFNAPVQTNLLTFSISWTLFLFLMFVNRRRLL